MFLYCSIEVTEICIHKGINITTQEYNRTHKDKSYLSYNRYLSCATRNTIPLVVSPTAILSPLTIVHSVGNMQMTQYTGAMQMCQQRK